MNNLIRIEEGNGHPLASICKKGWFRNHALILDQSVKWGLYKNPFGFRVTTRTFADEIWLNTSQGNTFILEGKDNYAFSTNINGLSLYSLHSNRNYEVTVFKYNEDLLLTLQYAEEEFPF